MAPKASKRSRDVESPRDPPEEALVKSVPATAAKPASGAPLPVPAPAPGLEAFPCPVFDQMRGRPCGEPAEADSLTCKTHRARPTRTQLSRIDAARKRYG